MKKTYYFQRQSIPARGQESDCNSFLLMLSETTSQYSALPVMKDYHSYFIEDKL